VRKGINFSNRKSICPINLEGGMEMKQFSNFKAWSSGFFLGIILVLSMIFTTNILNAQTSGSIVGKVTDARTGKNLMGANVVLKGTYYGAATDRWGNYSISNVPFGKYTLVVMYIGYEKYTTEVKVAISKPLVKHDVLMKMSVVELQALTVEGLREGQMKALSQQRTSPTIANIVAQEQMERFPDYNVADVLQRVPGIYIEKSGGEGRYALVRGTEPRLSTLKVNGITMPSTRHEERYSSLDMIGSAQLASIRVVKALTPDMDGDAIGGSINLVLRSAFDYPTRRVKLSLGSGYSRLGEKALGSGKFMYSNLFGANKSIGLMISANWDRLSKHSHGIELEWGKEEDITGSVIPWALQDIKISKPMRVRDRYGFSVNLGYRPNENNRWFIRGMWNRYRDDEQRWRYRVRVSKGDYLNPEGTLTQKSRFVMDTKDRVEKDKEDQYSFGGFHHLGHSIDLDYVVSYSSVYEKRTPEIDSDWEFGEKANLALDLSNPNAPKWNITNMENDLLYDPTMWEFDGIDYENIPITSHATVGALNLKIPYMLGGLPSELKFGGKVSFEKKERDTDTWKYKWKGDEDVMMDQMPSNDIDYHFLNDEYRFGPGSDFGKLKDFFYKNRDNDLRGEYDWWDSIGEDYVARENIYAYYAMTTIHMGDLMFVGGFREEITRNKYDGTKLFCDEEGDYQSSEKVSYDSTRSHFLPMMQLRYRVTPMTNLRLALTRTLARPNYWDLAPYFFVQPGSERIRTGNPGLKPTIAWNLDLMFEQYFRGIGIVSGGFFYKDLDGIIFTRTSYVTGGIYDGYRHERPINGGKAKLYGYEVAMNRQFTFLPGFLSGFGIYANYTHTWADADLGFSRAGFLPGQAGDVGNVAFTYEKYGFQGRLSIMYQAKFLQEVGETEEFDLYQDDHLQIDFSASQKIVDGLQAFVQCINLTNEPKRIYMGNLSRPIEISYYSWWIRAGLKWDLK